LRVTGVNPASQRDLKILNEIAQGHNVTQRALSESLGIALGLTNLYLKRLARKGYIKITTIPSNRLKYLLTPKGIAEKTRLTYEYMAFSLVLYRETREALRQTLHPLIESGLERVALYGTGEAAELAYLGLREMGLEPMGVFADGGPARFLGMPVRPTEELLGLELDGVIVSTFNGADPRISELVRLGLPSRKLIYLGRARTR
jgi:DNA-binding MarR family transcriptional regulator